MIVAAKKQTTFSEAFWNPLPGGNNENPILILMLGLCPAMAVTTSLQNGFAMGMGVIFVLLCSNTVISLLRNVIPKEVRIPCFITVIATAVTVVDMTMAATVPAIHEELGIFIALIVVNCIILGRAEGFASKNPTIPAIGDALGMGLGFTGTLCILGGLREIFGAGALGGVPLFKLFGYVGLESWVVSLGGTIDWSHSLFFVLPPGAFLFLGLMMAATRVATRPGEEG